MKGEWFHCYTCGIGKFIWYLGRDSKRLAIKKAGFTFGKNVRCASCVRYGNDTFVKV